MLKILKLFISCWLFMACSSVLADNKQVILNCFNGYVCLKYNLNRTKCLYPAVVNGKYLACSSSGKQKPITKRKIKK